MEPWEDFGFWTSGENWMPSAEALRINRCVAPGLGRPVIMLMDCLTRLWTSGKPKWTSSPNCETAFLHPAQVSACLWKSLSSSSPRYPPAARAANSHIVNGHSSTSIFACPRGCVINERSF